MGMVVGVCCRKKCGVKGNIMIRVSNIKIRLAEIDDPKDELHVLKQKLLIKLKIPEKALKHFRIAKKSVDARKKDDICLVYSVDADVKNEELLFRRADVKDVTYTPDKENEIIVHGSERLEERPVIVGMGPAGLFAGLMLSRHGYRPILVDRGEDVDSRVEKIEKFWDKGILDPESNVQFGEGGAGTFSDGKLTTLINDKRCAAVLEEFVKAGAPKEIIYHYKPHIGTDLLRSVVKNIRNEIIANGGEVRFRTKVTDLIIKDGKIHAVRLNDNETLRCGVVLLALGHSARDTFEMLKRRGVNIIPKPFSIGVRIEHPQKLINFAQYGDAAEHPMLGAADYKLAYHSKNGRSAYTFCMCPGGYVVAAASEHNGVVTNGMSEYKRDGRNANAALLVGVTPGDFMSDDPLAGVEFQRKWERLAFKLGGESYMAPAQLVGDFLNDRKSTGFGSVVPTYRPGVVPAELKNCLPAYVVETMKEAILYFDRKLKGFALPDGVLTGVETRSSSPVRILRNENFTANIDGVYPVGEGAGYAGGIMSSAVDGIRVAEKVMEKYSPI
ncbi:FAD dependent oxidoreductase [Thermoclostridium stercorarium subsp. stercorarium DSM 8532]|jgi:uncharacterized FAD-dependent dehydrogenase|uniref:FAD dependent oxidoreductase n=2 Tax=Thermoclostridium stercorarium TaxID=1510 RepID=L7VQJ3_THES1|nr:NAD(P)/FAD-dependent oxidoreductase [Thermoclostridium stercorarium]AGC68656.1 FAD dependent oxidoreductase [Thermoclostridium stercorarium subsp. stercorarium DSM 8532]AGI39669.1 dehydrogenase [Thermoclostridium stercorarium subsp. stercorarium DSM 8532]UZQ84639.1 NAD(P)/FAD-dependent oxidoreductase [Thermoclostridium stercorarium]